MTEGEERDGYRRAARLGANLALQDLLLQGLEVVADVERLRGTLNVDSPDPAIRWGRSEGREQLRFDIHYSLYVRLAQDAGDEDPVFTLQAQLALNYECPETLEVSDEDALAFGTQSVLFSSYPYFRELVHTMTSRTGLPPLVLGTLRLPIPHRGEAEDADAVGPG